MEHRNLDDRMLKSGTGRSLLLTASVLLLLLLLLLLDTAVFRPTSIGSCAGGGGGGDRGRISWVNWLGRGSRLSVEAPLLLLLLDCWIRKLRGTPPEWVNLSQRVLLDRGRGVRRSGVRRCNRSLDRGEGGSARTCLPPPCVSARLYMWLVYVLQRHSRRARLPGLPQRPGPQRTVA